MTTWARYSVVVYVGLMFAGTMLVPQFAEEPAENQRMCNSSNRSVRPARFPERSRLQRPELEPIDQAPSQPRPQRQSPVIPEIASA